MSAAFSPHCFRLMMRCSFLFAAVCGVLLIAALLIGRIMPEGRQLVYVSRLNDFESALRLVDLERRQTITLVSDGHRNSEPVWSPDGKTLAYLTERDGFPTLSVISLDDWQPRHLTLAPYRAVLLSFSWSPDSKNLVVLLNTPDGRVIRVLAWDAVDDGRDLLRGFAVAPAWSPDGEQIAYYRLSAQPPGGRLGLSLMRPDGTPITPEPLVTAEGTYGQLYWSPDGERIAYMTNGQNNGQFFLLDMRSGAVANLTANVIGHNFWFSWSPDGTQAVFSSNRDGDFEIYTANFDAGGIDLRKLTDNSTNDFDPAWSPDSAWLAFVSGMDGSANIYLMHVATQQIKRLTYAIDSHPAWRPRKQ